MSKGPMLRSLVAERLTAAAEEIFVLIEKTVLEYEEELCRSKEENERKQQLLDTVLSPQINRAGVQFRMLSRTEESECIFQEPAQPLTTAHKIQIEEISDDEPEPEGEAEPEGGGEAESVPQFTVETAEPLEERHEQEPQEIDMEPDKEDNANQVETNEEVTDAQTSTDSQNSKKKRRKHRKSAIKYGNTKRINKHQCTVCGKILKGPRNNLLRHMIIHTGEKPYSCSVCKKQFTQHCYFKSHMEAHEKEAQQKQVETVELETFGCSICEMRFKRQVTLKKHMESHNVAKESKPQTRKEMQAELRKEVGIQHDPPKIKVQDEEAETHPETGADYTQAMLIKNAMTSAHAAPGDFECNICHRTFTTRTRLKRHMIVHTGAKPFSCPVCHKFFSQKYNVRLHMAVHTNEKPYTCEICLKSYRRNDDLRTHMATHTGQILFSCMVCNAAFKQRNCLASHMRLHTGDRPYRCSVCDKTFIQKSNLNRHSRSHTGEKPFRCPVCPQRFLQRSDIRKHMSVHT